MLRAGAISGRVHPRAAAGGPRPAEARMTRLWMALVLGASLVLLSAAALYGLQRMLGIEEETRIHARDAQREDT